MIKSIFYLKPHRIISDYPISRYPVNELTINDKTFTIGKNRFHKPIISQLLEVDDEVGLERWISLVVTSEDYEEFQDGKIDYQGLQSRYDTIYMIDFQNKEYKAMYQVPVSDLTSLPN